MARTHSNIAPEALGDSPRQAVDCSIMDPTSSPFAHARPRVSLPRRKEILSLLDLPGEIRNRIYQYYFEDAYRCELVGKGCDFSSVKPRTVKLLSNSSKPKGYHEKDRGDTVPEDPLVLRFPHCRRPNFECRNTQPHMWLNRHGALALTCTQIHRETLPLLYQRITFVFEAPRRITSFLRRAPKPNLSYVMKLHLYYTTYGSPEAACHSIWQKKHIESWNRVCKLASERLTCLRELEIDIWLTEGAPKFNLRQNYLQPLWHFRRLTHIIPSDYSVGRKLLLPKPHALVTVNVRVKTRLWAHDFETNQRLANACKHLHRLYGHGISNALLGAKEEEAMSGFDKAWNGKYKIWQHHLGFARTGW